MKKSFFRRVILLLLFFFTINSGDLKAENLDSLRQVLKVSKEDTNKVKVLLEICSQYGLIDPEESMKFSKEALDLSEKLNYQRGKIKSLILLSENYNDKGEYELSLKSLNKALQLCRETNENPLLFSKVNLCMAAVYSYKGEYNKALAIYLESLKVLEAANQKQEAAKTMANLAIVYYQNDKMVESKQYAERSKIIFEELKDSVSLSAALSLIATIYYHDNDYPRALSYYMNSLKYCEGLSDKSYLSTNLNGIGIVYADQKKYAEAIPYFKKGLVIAEETDDQQAIATYLLNLGICYSGLNQYAQAMESYNKGLSISKKIGSKFSIKEIYHYMSEAHIKQGNFKAAVESLQQFIITNDSVYNEENSQQINELSVKYESEKKAKEIALLNIELLTKEKDQKLLSAQLFGTIAGSVLLILFLVLLFNRRKLLQANRHQLEINAEREKNVNAIVQAQEQEQARIAKDLHDGIGSLLSTLKINLQLYDKFIPAEKTGDFQSTLGLIDNMSVELRNIMQNLSNETLQEEGLVAAFEELIRRVNTLGVTRFEFHTHGLPRHLPAILESGLYRVGQELVTNCIKHAKASSATLQLLADQDHMTLMMEDNGIGFMSENPASKNSMGIKNIYERIGFLKGSVRFESDPQKGTVCVIEIPKPPVYE